MHSLLSDKTISFLLLPLLVVLGIVTARQGSFKGGEDIPTIKTTDWSIRNQYCDQPLFVNLLPMSRDDAICDNFCVTFFPLADDPDTFTVYFSRVLCDGSYNITTFIATQIETGVSRRGAPFKIGTDVVLGYAGCDTYIILQITNFRGYGNPPAIIGLSSSSKPIGLSCLKKVEEIVQESGLPKQEFFAPPMKLPNRCVTQQLCVIQNKQNQFYKAIGLTGPIYNNYIY